MKILSLQDLPFGRPHILFGLISGEYLSHGGLNFKAPRHRSHDVGCTCKSCDGEGRHVHADFHEVFIILQGKARMEVNGESHDLCAGNVVVCEPGEDHHLVSDVDDPCVNIYLHASDTPRQARKDAK